MNEKLKLKQISNTQKYIFFLIGWILSILTLGLCFYLFYSNFFERQHYLDRKNLLKWLESNNLPNVDITYFKHYCWKFDEFTLQYSDEFREDTVFLFLKNECILSNFHSGVQDKKNYNKIKKVIKEKIDLTELS